MEPKQSWDPKMNVGSNVIDNQHQVLFDLIKDLNSAIRAGESVRVVDTLLSVLLNYAFQHFETEEKYFRNHKDYVRHCLEHYGLLKKLNDFIVDFRNNRPVSDKTPSDFLEHWLLDHIEKYDRPYLSHETADKPLMEEENHVDEFEPEIKDRRHHKRIQHNEVVDGDIRVYCYNATQLKGRTATVVDMSPGGLLLKSNSRHEIDDLLIISCTIGSNFKMKEKVRVKTAKDNRYGVVFVSPSLETTDFFTKLYGSVHLRHHRPV